MKLLIINPYHVDDIIGGAEVQLDLLAVKLVELGIDVDFVAKSVSIPTVETDKKTKSRNYRLFRFANLDIRTLNARLDKDYDYIINRGRKIENIVSSKYAKLVGAKLIIFTSMDQDCNYLKFTFRSPLGLIGIIKRVITFWQDINLDIKSYYIIKNAYRVYFQTHEQRHRGRSIGIDGRVLPNIHKIPDGEVAKQSEFTVLWLATLKEWKRPEVYINLAKSMKNDKKVKFIIASKNLPPRYGKLIRDAQYEGANISFELCDSLERSNELISKARVLINTSLPLEGFPNVFIQAWLRKTLVMSLEFDPDKLLSKKKLGILAGSSDNLKKQIMSYSETTDEMKQYIDRAYEYSRVNHDANVIVERILCDLSSLDKS